MEPVSLFTLASKQVRWLSVRQSTIAGNIANANTPGFRAQEVESFKNLLDSTRVTMKVTDPRHVSTGATQEAFAVRQKENGDIAVVPSENTVSLETELVNAGEVRRDFELNTAIVKAFHRMILMTSKS